MINQLSSIILQKQHEVAELKKIILQRQDHAINKILQYKVKRESSKSFKHGLRQSTLAVIAEIKRKSPSKGFLSEIHDPVDLANKYITGGASALSVLTDNKYFNGSIEDIEIIVNKTDIKQPPILRKDFIIDAIQIAESIVAGADAILAIVAVLGSKTKTILDISREFGIEVLVEIHNKSELEVALNCGAEIIGVNNRNLSTFEVNTENALELIVDIPDYIIKVAESGIQAPEIARQYHKAGFDAVLIGEALVKSNRPDEFIRSCRYE